jgi:hypothetical protein
MTKINARVTADCAHCGAELPGNMLIQDEPIAAWCNKCKNFTLVEVKLVWRKLIDSFIGSHD